MGDYYKEFNVCIFFGGVGKEIKFVEFKWKYYNGLDKFGLLGRLKLGVLFSI